MIVFMNFATTTSPNLASGMMSRFSAECRRDMALLSVRHGRLARPRNFSVWIHGCRSRSPEDDATLRFASLRTLGAVFRPALLAVLDSLGVEHAAQDVVAHAGQVLDPAAADHDHRVLLQVVAFARDIADDLEAVGQPHLGDLAQSRVRLLRRRRIDARAHATLLRARLEMAGLFTVGLRLPRLADQLTNRRHVGPKLQFPRRPAVTEQKIQFHLIDFARAGKATRETNSALKTPMGLWAPPKSRGSRRKDRDRAKQNRPLRAGMARHR